MPPHFREVFPISIFITFQHIFNFNQILGIPLICIAENNLILDNNKKDFH